MDVDRHVDEVRTIGYSVVSDAVPAALCEAVLDAIGRELGVWLDDPASWERVSTVIDQVPLWSHQSQWEIRQLPHLYDLWSALWNDTALWSDLNSCRFTPPWTPGAAGPLPVHFDVDPRDPAQQWYPGIVALTDAGAGHGGFCCVPEMFDRPDLCPDQWTHTEHGVEYRPDVTGLDVVEVPLSKGDLLVFDSRLPHGTVRNTGGTPRAVFYLQLHPCGTPSERAERLADIDAGRCPPWWRWKPGHDRLDPQPLELTDLGKRLLGRREWDTLQSVGSASRPSSETNRRRHSTDGLSDRTLTVAR